MWRAMVGLAMLALAAAQCLAQAGGGCPRKVLIITGQSDLPHHQWRETTAAIRSILTAARTFDVYTTEEPRGLTAEALAGYQAVIVNYNGPRWPAEAERALENYVRGGGGLFAFHLSAYGPFFGMVQEGGRFRTANAEWAGWAGMIGARWEPAKVGHAPRGPFAVRWRPESTIGKGAKFVANDELYHRLTLLKGAAVEATATSPAQGGSGQEEPIVWTNHYGRGRVFFTTLGHDAMAFHQTGMRDVVSKGVEWAAAGSAIPCPVTAAAPIRVLVVTQGHSYPVEFYAMINSLEGITWTHATSHPEAFRRPLEDRYDVVLLHDMLDVTPPETKQRLRAFVEAGRGVVSIHHAIVNYTDWPWWYEEIVGGKYFIKPLGEHAASGNREGVDFIVAPVAGKRAHPVLKGVGPLTVNDEVYHRMWFSPRIDVLMETNHLENDRPVVYTGPSAKVRSVFIQLGHSASTMEDPGFRRLVGNAVEWAAGRVN